VPELGELARGLDARMAERGDWPARSPWIRDAVAALPRDRFAPDRLYRWDGQAVYEPVDRAADPDGWAAELYTSQDTAAVTQVTDGLATSSLSCQGVVANMLDALRLEPGHRALELGTGSGWNAALLSARTGRVVSVEVDQSLASAARDRLKAAESHVDVHVGDGALGWPEGAPYDRVISTYAVDAIPWPWVEQCRPGGRIVTPWGRLGHVALTVTDIHQAAIGWVQGLAQFMPARGTQPTLDYGTVRGTGPADTERTLTRDLTPLTDNELRNDPLRFALRVAFPDVQIIWGTDEDGGNLWLHDGRSSWAALNADDSTVIAYQGGPRRLADELEHAWDQWLSLGSPTLWDYGLTVERDRQYAWCRSHIDGPRWPIVGDLPALTPLID
jgi:protein-L-isoaspartate(D-aspartate) O-methyltransferase